MIDGLLHHLPMLPIAVPLMAGALMLLVRDPHRRIRAAIGICAALVQLVAALALLRASTQGVGVYLLADWPAPFGIVVVVDRLAAIMLVLSATLATAALVYATARWDKMGVHFHPLFQFLLMGLNGAFLTGDIFNLFVFFEVLLAASYGLLLYGSGEARVASGLHYIAVNLIGSLVMLIGIALIYGVAGTLNMADLAVQAGDLGHAQRPLFETGAALLSIAFLIKAAAWPLNFWLPGAYASAAAPVAGVFAIMTKVGIYALLRVGSLLVPTGAPAAFGGDWMFPLGLATLVFGTLGLLASQRVGRLAGFATIVSSGTLLAALGMPGVVLTAPALFYLISSVLSLGAFYMLIEMVERTQPFGADLLAITQEAFDVDEPDTAEHADEVVGVAIPAAMAFLGLAFISCALLIAGVPPLTGFVAKFALLSAALQSSGMALPSSNAWLLVAAVLASGLAGIIALARIGMRMFWSSEDLNIPRLRVSEAGPVAALIFVCIGLVVYAGPVMSYLEQTARALDHPSSYVEAVLEQAPLRRVSGGHSS